jgi:hypothetical protein
MRASDEDDPNECYWSGWIADMEDRRLSATSYCRPSLVPYQVSYRVPPCLRHLRSSMPDSKIAFAERSSKFQKNRRHPARLVSSVHFLISSSLGTSGEKVDNSSNISSVQDGGSYMYHRQVSPPECVKSPRGDCSNSLSQTTSEWTSHPFNIWTPLLLSFLFFIQRKTTKA